MSDYGQLAATGTGPLIVGGLVANQTWLVAAGFGLVLASSLLIRFGWRRGQSVTD